jgi:lysozyme
MAALNAAGLELIKAFEGLRFTAYRDAVGVWTIGYGHTDMTGKPPRVRAGLRITEGEAEEILRSDLEVYEDAVRAAVTVDLNDNQYSALVSFTYNVGPGNLLKSSVLARVNARRFDQVPARLMLWNRAGGKVLRGLTRRRAAEGELFMRAPAAAPPAPAPSEPGAGLLQTLIDFFLNLFRR